MSAGRVVVAGLVAAFAAASYFVWLPDALLRHRIVVATARSENGDGFVLTQAWGFDFYSTRLSWTRPDGSTEEFVVDGDDRKIWWGRIELEQGSGVARIVENGALRATLDWRRSAFDVMR